MNSVFLDLEPLNLELSGFGFFPNPKKPRVFFISTTYGDILKSLTDNLEDKLDLLGFKKEGKFKSHLTIARIKIPKNIPLLLESIKAIDLKGKFKMNKVDLMKSTLTDKGPIYEIVFSTNLTK